MSAPVELRRIDTSNGKTLASVSLGAGDMGATDTYGARAAIAAMTFGGDRLYGIWEQIRNGSAENRVLFSLDGCSMKVLAKQQLADVPHSHQEIAYDQINNRVWENSYTAELSNGTTGEPTSYGFRSYDGGTLAPLPEVMAAVLEVASPRVTSHSPTVTLQVVSGEVWIGPTGNNQTFRIDAHRGTASLVDSVSGSDANWLGSDGESIFAISETQITRVFGDGTGKSWPTEGSVQIASRRVRDSTWAIDSKRAFSLDDPSLSLPLPTSSGVMFAVATSDNLWLLDYDGAVHVA